MHERDKEMSDQPQDAEARRKVKPVICYPNETLPVPDLNSYRAARRGQKVDEILVPARDARTFRADAEQFSHFVCRGAAGGRPEPVSCKSERTVLFGQNPRAAWHAHHNRGTHVVILSYLRPWRRLWKDTLNWYGVDEYGRSVHDVIGTRCDPYTGNLLSGISITTVAIPT